MVRFIALLLVISLCGFANPREEVLVPALKGIVVSDSDSKMGEKSTDGIRIGGNLCIPDKLLSCFIGQPVTMCLLDEIRYTIEDYYRCEGFPLVGVRIPAGQNITDGSLYVVVLVGQLGNVCVTEMKWFSEQHIADQISLYPGDQIQTAPLVGDLRWINRNPFLTTTLAYEKGEGLCQTNIELITQDRFPLRLYGGYENNGNIVAGDSRFFTGFNVGRFFVESDELNFQLMSSNNFDKWWGAQGNYSLFFPWRHILKLFGGYNRVSAPLESVELPPVMTPEGVGWQVGTRYTVVLPDFIHYFHELIVGYDFKRTNNFLNFSEALIFNNFFDISQFILSYRGNFEGDFGFCMGEVVLYMSPGGMSAFNKDRDFSREREGAKSNYLYGKASVEGVIRIPADFSWEFSLVGQASSGKLLPIEELSVGG